MDGCRRLRVPSRKEIDVHFDIITFDAILYGVMQSGDLRRGEKYGGFNYRQTEDVFRYYFKRYEKYMHNPHPHIRREQIYRIARNMSFIEAQDDRWINLYPEDYPIMIDLHFATHYHDCNYNINHFFSGKIREMRYYEMQAGYRVKGSE